MVLASVVWTVFACATEPPPDSGFVPVGETTELFYRAIGQGDPLLIVHGGPGMDHRYLLPGMEILAQGRRVIFYDQRGVGASTGPIDSSAISWDALVDDIDRLRTFLDYDRIDVLGHSWGGLLALEYAARYPQRARSLILLNSVEPGQRYNRQIRGRQLRRRTAADSAAIAQLMASDGFRARDPETMRSMYRVNFRTTFADTSRISELSLDMTEQTFRNGSNVARLVMGPFADFDMWMRIRDVQAPTLILHGTGDVLPLDVVWQMAEDIPNARVVLLNDAGHFPYIEAPERMRESIDAFLSERDR
jgi:proline iminopeptidase